MEYNSQAAVDFFITNPKMLEKSSGKFIKGTLGKGIFTGCSKSFVYKAKEKARQILHNTEVAGLQSIIAEKDEMIAKYIGSKTTSEHGLVKNFQSNKPLSPTELKQLAGVDDITTTLGMVWDKLSPSGIWTYSIQVKFLINNFYVKEELERKLKELFPNNLTPFKLPEPDFFHQELAGFLYISDDHVGLKYGDSLFNAEYSGEIYEERMMKLANKVVKDLALEHLYIVRLGDEVDGWNAKTTRQDHPLESQSNKEQFDIYTSVNKKFYDTIFSSGMADKYTVINCNNSNHSGLGFSYMLNKSLEFYLEAKYPDVEFKHFQKFIETVEWGNHVIGLTHGKDEKYMKRPLPLNLDKDTDLFLMEYYDKQGFSPSKRWISTVKGDIHKLNINDGKSGRYVNVPSIAGGSNWIEHNFGFSKPGALIELYDKNEPEVATINIRF